MIKLINKHEYKKNKEKIYMLIKELFEDDNDSIADLEGTMDHLDFIFSQLYNEAFLFLDIEENIVNGMVNFLEYDNQQKNWCLFSVYTKKEFRRNKLALNIIKEGINVIKSYNGNSIIAGIENNNIASQKLHEKLGFIYSGKNWDEIAEGFPENHLAYVLDIKKRGLHTSVK